MTPARTDGGKVRAASPSGASGPVVTAVRVRRLAVVVPLLATAALAVLWPPPRRGLVLYAAGEAAQRVASAYTARTGEPVTVVRLFTGPLLARISAEGRRPGWTLAWFDGDMAAASLDRAGLLARDIVPRADWSSTGRALIPADGAWTPLGLTLAAVVVERRRTPGPSNWGALAGGEPSGGRTSDAGGAGPIGLPDPAFSGPGYAIVAAGLSQAGGWPAGRALWRHLRDRGLVVSATSPDVVSDLRAGRIARAMIQSGTAYALADRTPGMVVTPLTPAVVLPNVIAMAERASPAQRAAAARFVRFALSPPGQRVRLESGKVDAYYWPLTTGVGRPPAIMPALKSLPLRHLDPVAWGGRQAEVTRWFEAEVAR